MHGIERHPDGMNQVHGNLFENIPLNHILRSPLGSVPQFSSCFSSRQCFCLQHARGVLNLERNSYYMYNGFLTPFTFLFSLMLHCSLITAIYKHKIILEKTEFYFGTIWVGTINCSKKPFLGMFNLIHITKIQETYDINGYCYFKQQFIFHFLNVLLH